MVDATIIVVAIAKVVLAWHLFRQARGITMAMTRADAARLKARVLAEVERVKAVQV